MNNQTLSAVLAQYEKNSASGNTTKVTSEERQKKYFSTALPKGVTSLQKRIRILPTDIGSPFKEAYFHEVKVDGMPMKLYDPKQDGKRSPLNEVYDGLQATGNEEDKLLSYQYRSKKFFIVKLIDRDNENDGPKFWRFKFNSKKEGIMDKIHPIFVNKGDITDPEKGRDLILTLTLSKSGKGSEYTTVNSVIPDDMSPLHTDASISQSWLDDKTDWTEVYSKKPEEYLEMVAQGETPKWDFDLKKYVSSSQTEEQTNMNETGDNKTSNPTSSPLLDPQENASASDDLPF